MFIYDWSRFTKRIDVKASVSKIYQAWATQGGLEEWFLRIAEFRKPNQQLRKRNRKVEAGDTYRWLWHGYSDKTVETGRILKVNGKDFVQFSFAGDCTVSIYIKKERGTTVVELVQENIPVKEEAKVNFHLGCSIGWTFYLANLKSVLEGGLDLRNRNEQLIHMINA